MLALLSPIDLTAVIVLTVFATAVLLTGRAVHLNVRDVKATVEAAAGVSQDAADTLGVRNGNGDVTTMLARALGELGELRASQEQHYADDLADFEAVNERLANFAALRADVDELTAYAHKRFHDVLGALTVDRARTELMWAVFLQQREEGKKTDDEDT